MKYMSTQHAIIKKYFTDLGMGRLGKGRGGSEELKMEWRKAKYKIGESKLRLLLWIGLGRLGKEKGDE